MYSITAEMACCSPVMSEPSSAVLWLSLPRTLLMSRATDRRGQTQPTREAWLQRYGAQQRYHYNAIQAWKVNEDGTLANVYA